MVQITDLLQAAGVPPTLWPEAQASIDKARAAHGWTLGLMTLRKHYVRLFKAGKIAKLLPWSANRLLDVRPDLAEWDIAPVRNVTCNGDNMPWDESGPVAEPWSDPDLASADYRFAVLRNYWLHGTHPRSPEARKAWYRRNACEYVAWERGSPVGAGVQEWTGGGITVLRSGDAWQIHGAVPLLGPLKLKIDIGYEVANVFVRRADQWVQGWYPLPGYELRACVVWMRHPVWLRGS